MSEAGWRAFLAADGTDDWAVLHGGATTAFRVADLGDAARLAEAIAGVPGVGEAGAVLTLTGSTVTVRITRDLWTLQAYHAELARAISGVARAHGAKPEPSVIQEVQLAIAAKPDSVHLDFWRAVLGYVPMSDDNGVDPLGTGSTVWMQELDETKPLRHAMHVDVSVPRSQAQSRLAAALATGGRIVVQSAEHWTLADRAGNRVCIAVWPDGGTTGPIVAEAG
jgi:4a-hydroxytetrahydrobiopterin dehydratase